MVGEREAMGGRRRKKPGEPQRILKNPEES